MTATTTGAWIASAECNALACRTRHELPIAEEASMEDVKAAFEAKGWRIAPTICPEHTVKAQHDGCLFTDTTLGWGDWPGIDGAVMICLTHGHPCGDGKAYDGDPTSQCTAELGTAR